MCRADGEDFGGGPRCPGRLGAGAECGQDPDAGRPGGEFQFSWIPDHGGQTSSNRSEI